MAEQKEVYPIDTFQVTLGGAETGGLFNTVSGISSSIDPTGFDHVDAQGKPQVAKTPAKVHWGDLVCSRGMDKDMALWKWHYELHREGHRGQPQGHHGGLLDTKGTTVLTWSLTNAWPSSYSGSGQDASSGVVATESISFTYERLERK